MSEMNATYDPDAEPEDHSRIPFDYEIVRQRSLELVPSELVVSQRVDRGAPNRRRS